VPAIGSSEVRPTAIGNPDPAALRHDSTTPLNLVKLTQLMKLTSGKRETLIGLIDGPVAIDHPDLVSKNIRAIPGKVAGACTQANSVACAHGTLVAGILSAKRTSFAPAICPDCTLFVRPIFTESVSGQMPTATPKELAAAIFDCIEAGVRVVNLSMALSHPGVGESDLKQALDQASVHGVIVVAASGNQGSVGSSVISSHPWVIPVVAYNLQGIPLSLSNLGRSTGLRGLGAPGEGIVSTAPGGQSLTFGGTSAAAAFVTGTIALLWSEIPAASAADIKFAVSQASRPRRTTVVPPLLNAWAAFQYMATAQVKRK
jgi:subtilisin family serine protease